MRHTVTLAGGTSSLRDILTLLRGHQDGFYATPHTCTRTLYVHVRICIILQDPGT